MLFRLRKWTRRTAIVVAVAGTAAFGFDHYNEHVLSRNARTIINAVRIGYMYKTTDPETPEALSALHAAAATIILDTCLTNEGLYIKLGQGLSVLNHLLPEEYTQRLRVLLDQAPTVPLAEVQRIFREETGKEFLDVFVAFDENPVASASIAQVHKAVLRKPDGSLLDVAVKVQKPNIRKQIWWDLECHTLVCRMLQYAFDLPLTWSAQCIAENLTKEIDFKLEAANTIRAKEMLKHRSDVYIPLVMEELVSDRLLVTEWIDAVKMVDIDTINRQFCVPNVLQTVLEAFGEMIFEHGFVHCDPHAANLMVRRRPSSSVGGNNKKNYQVVLLDFGLCVQESEKFRLEYALLFKSIFTGDRETLRDVVRSWGIGHADLFASLTIQKPFTSKPVHSAAVTKSDVLEMERLMKDHVKSLLEREELIPQELIFVGRSMNLLRSLNKSYGAPVNRVNILAGCAVRGLKHMSFLEDIQQYLLPLQQAHSQQKTRDVGSVVYPPSGLHHHRHDWLRSMYLYLHFQWILWWITVVHVTTQWFNKGITAVAPQAWASRLRMGNLEEQLDKQEAFLKEQRAANRFHQPMKIGTND